MVAKPTLQRLPSVVHICAPNPHYAPQRPSPEYSKDNEKGGGRGRRVERSMGERLGKGKKMGRRVGKRMMKRVSTWRRKKAIGWR